MGFFMSDINFCNTKEQLNHLGEVVTGKADGSPTGADIDTSTLPYTGQIRKTLPYLEAEYLNAIRNAGGEPINNGTWSSGQTFTAYNQFMVYNGIPYKPLTTSELPYGPTGDSPDVNFVGPYESFSIEEAVTLFGNRNELSNSNFLTPSPDAITHPNATPESYVAGTQIFSGVYAGDSGCTITFIDGRVNCTAGDYQFKVPNTGGLERVPVFTSSVSDYDGIPKTTGVSNALVSDEYLVTVTPAAGDVFSVKLEQGEIATKHEVFTLLSSSVSHNNTTVKESLDSADKLSSVGFLVPNPSDDWLYLDKAIKKVATQQGVEGQGNLEMLPFLPFAGYNLLDLNGRTLTLDRPLELPNSSGFGIMNGCITGTDDFTIDEYLIQTTSSADELDLHKFAMINILLHGKRRANLMQLDKFLDVHLLNCHGYAFNSVGVNPKGGSVSHELYVSGGKWEKNTYKDNQSGLDNSGTVFLVDAFDCEFKPAFVGGIDEDFVFGRNEAAQFCSIDDTHIATGINMETGILVNQNSIQGFSACGNYIDGCKVILENCTGATLNRNRFLNSSASRPSDNFVELRPTSGGQTLSDFTAKNNKFISNGNQFEAFFVDETNGTFTSVNNGTEIESNSRNGNVTLKQLVARGGKFVSSGNQAVFDFSDDLLLDPNFAIPGIRNASFATNPSPTTTISGKAVTVDTGSTITGSVDIEVRRRG
ncbi:hypothetical protein NVP1291O_42 [Vibrio phage 1.291.O._10N.286.55.F6]|nr:hypothetical protein NVP1291O_42 [Vibrio phage 1.291.O._10N.286.55.F6]